MAEPLPQEWVEALHAQGVAKDAVIAAVGQATRSGRWDPVADAYRRYEVATGLRQIADKECFPNGSKDGSG